MAEKFITYYQSPLGLLQIEGTANCISMVEFRNNTAGLPPSTSYLPELGIQCTEQLIQYFSGARRNFELPVEQEGTSFQRNTWSLLMNIPFGKTISYLQLAVNAGDAKATRAVANANSKNKVAIIVPCHRVIGANRELTGYAGGLWRKQRLLEHETRIMYGVQTLF